MRKGLIIIALFGLTVLSSVVRAECGGRVSTGNGCGSPRCSETPTRQDCSCSDPYCFSHSSCLSQAECCRVFGNVGGYKYDEDDTTPSERADDYSFNDDAVYKGTVYSDYKGERS